jgi:hypothetical protein
MDERVEAFLADVLALQGKDADAIRKGVRVVLTDSEQANEGKGGSRVPGAMPGSRSRGDTIAEGNADRRALKASPQHHRWAASSMKNESQKEEIRRRKMLRLAATLITYWVVYPASTGNRRNSNDRP